MTYINNKYHSLFFALNFLFFIFGLYSLFFIGLIIYAALIYFYRKKKYKFNDDFTVKEGALYSLANGKIKNIKKLTNHSHFGENLTEIQITLYPWDEFGLYMPFSGLISNLVDVKSGSKFRMKSFTQDGVDKLTGDYLLSLSNNNSEVGVQLVRCASGFQSELFIMPGDKAKSSSRIGYFPFGGTVLLYLPKNYEILVDEGDAVVGGETLLAGQRGFNDSI